MCVVYCVCLVVLYVCVPPQSGKNGIADWFEVNLKINSNQTEPHFDQYTNFYIVKDTLGSLKSITESEKKQNYSKYFVKHMDRIRDFVFKGNL